MLLFDADAMGLLRRDFIDTSGSAAAKLSRLDTLAATDEFRRLDIVFNNAAYGDITRSTNSRNAYEAKRV